MSLLEEKFGEMGERRAAANATANFLPCDKNAIEDGDPEASNLIIHIQ